MYDEKCMVKAGSNIRLLRTACQISQLAMAERIGVSQTHMSNLEHNNVQVSLKLLLRIANVFDCTLDAERQSSPGLGRGGNRNQSDRNGRRQCKRRQRDAGAGSVFTGRSAAAA